MRKYRIRRLDGLWVFVILMVELLPNAFEDREETGEDGINTTEMDTAISPQVHRLEYE